MCQFSTKIPSETPLECFKLSFILLFHIIKSFIPKVWDIPQLMSDSALPIFLRIGRVSLHTGLDKDFENEVYCYNCAVNELPMSKTTIILLSRTWDDSKIILWLDYCVKGPLNSKEIFFYFLEVHVSILDMLKNLCIKERCIDYRYESKLETVAKNVDWQIIRLMFNKKSTIFT